MKHLHGMPQVHLTSTPKPCGYSLGIGPLPVSDLGFVNPVFVGVSQIVNYLVLQPLLNMGPGILQFWDTIDDVDR